MMCSRPRYRVSLPAVVSLLVVAACSKGDDKRVGGAAAIEAPAPAVPDVHADATRPAPRPNKVDAHAAAPGPAYLGVAGTGLVRVDGGKAKTLISHRYRIHDIAIDPNGIAYAVAIGGVWAIEGDKVTPLPAPGKYPNLEHVAIGPDGVLWGLAHTGVSRWDGKAWTHEPAATFEAKVLHDIAVDRAGRVWVSTPEHLWRLDGDRWTRLDSKFTGAKRPFFHTVVAGPAGEVYATSISGVFVYEGDAWRELAFADNHIDELALGADGRIAASGGVGDVMVAAPGAAVRTVDLNGLGVKAHRADVMAVDGGGRTWLGTDNGVVILDANGKLAQQWTAGTVAGITGKIESIAVGGAGPALPTLGVAARGTVAGKVIIKGKPVPGATIEICEMPLTMFTTSPCDKATVARHATSDADGKFQIADVPVGSYGFAVKPKAKWLVFIGSDGCCTTLENGQVYDVGSITLDRLE